MRFTPDRATSIDLHIHETVRWSRYREDITVLAETVTNPFDDIDVEFWPEGATTDRIAGMLRAQRPDLIVVHQHMPTATRLSRGFPKTPVALVRHNFQKPPRTPLSRFVKRRQLGRLAEIAFVSECCRDDFRRNWPAVETPSTVVLNGVDGSLWHPAADKDRLVLFVGRLAPEKGALETATAMADALRERPDWTGRMIVSTASEHADYGACVKDVLSKTPGRIDLMTDVGHDAVRHWMGRAAIALAPTRTREPFGRVAIEAMASGAVLVASARGGFVEIAGDSAILLDDPDAAPLAAAMADLMDDEEKRVRLAAEGRERVIPRYDLKNAAGTFDALVERHCAPEAIR